MSNKSKTRSKESRKRIRTLILLIFLTAVFLIVSTYAWFSTQRDVYLTGLEGTVQVAKGLQISLDGATWTQTVDIGKDSLLAINEDTAVDGQIVNMVETSDKGMIPVSTDGTVSGTDTTLPMIYGDYGDSKITGAAVETESSGATGKYYAFDIFLLNTSDEGATVDTLKLNMAASTVGAGNTGTGLEYSARIGFALIGDSVEAEGTLPTQADILGALEGKTISKVAIWEPNVDKHTASIANLKKYIYTLNSTTAADLGDVTFGDEDGAGTGYKYVNFTTSSTLKTYAIKYGSTGTLTGIFNWPDGDYVTLQNTVQTVNNTASYTDAIALECTDGTGEFQIAANAVSRIRVYVWLEGQDVDAQNVASFGGTLTVDVSLTKDESSN